MKSDLLDLEVFRHVQTEKAILVSLTGNKNAAKWLPLSQVEVEDKGGGLVEVTLPEWLATEKGLI